MKVRLRITQVVFALLNWRDTKLAEAWYWNLTPMPASLPLNRQLFEGLTIFWLGFGRLAFCMERSEKEMNKALKEVNALEGAGSSTKS